MGKLIEPRILGFVPVDVDTSALYVADKDNNEYKVFDSEGELFTPDGGVVSSRLTALEQGLPPIDDARIVVLEADSFSNNLAHAVINGQLADIKPLQVDVADLELAVLGNTNDITDLETYSISKTVVDAKGDLIVATANEVVTRLPVGSDNYVLTADAAQASGMKWAAVAATASSVATDAIFDAKGDIVAGTGANTASRVALGTDGHVLTADSSQAGGVKWAAASVDNTATGIDLVERGVNVKPEGATGDGVTDDTTALQTVLTGGGIIFFPEGNYLTGKLDVASNSILVFHPKAKLTLKSGAAGGLAIRLVTNVTLYCNGAEFTQPNVSGTGHVIYIYGSTHINVFDCNINGSSEDDDGIYVGISGATICEDIVIQRGFITGCRRNGISVVAATRVLIDKVECCFSTGAPGAGIDIEANTYGQVSDCIVQNCYTHDNEGYGIVNSFGERTVIRNNISYNDGDGGITVTSAPTAALEANHRTQDRRGVASFSAADGWISVENGALAGPLGLELGSIISFELANGATTPAEIGTGRYFVNEKSTSDDTKIRVGTEYDYGTITSFSGTGTGTMALDHEASDIWIEDLCNEGVSSGCIVDSNLIISSLNYPLEVIGQVNTRITNNRIYALLDKACMHFAYARHAYIANNYLHGDNASTNSGAYGMNIEHCSHIRTYRNVIRDTKATGIRVSGCSHSILDGDLLINCGKLSNTVVALSNGVNAIVQNLKMVAEPRSMPNVGLSLASTVTNGLVMNCDAKGVGSSDANAIVLTSNTCRGRNNITRTGAFRADEN